jgi:DNA-binding NtrC family response regulator
VSDRILIVDDDQAMCELLLTQLKKKGFEADFRTSAEDALSAIEEKEYDAIVTDLNMPGMGGIELAERLKGNLPDVPIVVITSFGNMETAIAALRLGAYDFINKPFDTEVLALSLKRAVQHRRLSKEVKQLRRAVEEAGTMDDLVGASSKMQEVFKLIVKASESDVTVLITGESGTGKELVARALHRRSKRQNGPFVAINCAAMPETLLESEFFGHSKGAFTGAKEARKGLFVKSSGGTLLLDEIGEMPLTLQPKILRALEERSVRSLGSDTETLFDSRIIAASNRNLWYEVEEKRFREDLFYRLNVVHIELPPLRSRGGDILALAQRFLEEFALRMKRPVTGLSTAAAEKLLAYSWPGNVRELKNGIERAVALTNCDKITVEDLPERIKSYKSSHIIVASEDPQELVPMEEVEQRYIRRVLESVNGNKALAARILGFDRKTLYRKLERWGIGSGS